MIFKVIEIISFERVYKEKGLSCVRGDRQQQQTVNILAQVYSQMEASRVSISCGIVTENTQSEDEIIADNSPTDVPIICTAEHEVESQPVSPSRSMIDSTIDGFIDDVNIDPALSTVKDKQLSTVEVDYLISIVEGCRREKGTIDWVKVEKAWVLAVSNHIPGILPKEKKRLQFAMQNCQEKRKRVRLNENTTEGVHNDGGEMFQSTDNEILQRSSQPSGYADIVSESLSSHILQTSVVTSTSITSAPLITTSSTSSTLSTSFIPTSKVTTSSADLILRLKKDIDFTTEEKEFIRNFGLKRLRDTNPAQREVSHEDLKNAYKREEQFAGFWRKGKEMKVYWKGWIKDNKDKI